MCYSYISSYLHNLCCLAYVLKTSKISIVKDEEEPEEPSEPSEPVVQEITISYEANHVQIL